MTFRERLAQLDRLQNARLFKVIASGVLIAVFLAVVIGYAVAAAKHGIGAPAASAPSTGAAPDAGLSAAEETRQIVESIARAKSDPTAVAVAAGLGLVFLLAVVWLGIGLTYIVMLGALGLAVLPAVWVPGWRGPATLVGGGIGLTIAFTILLRVAQLALSPGGPVLAVARNVLAEAVRMKVSLVFIVLLILMLASLPGWLNPAEFLRYRVQVFLQYGTGGAYWVIALLTLAFAASTVSFDQRDRTIWQTMTKPVAPWQYVLGKWLGVVTLNAVLLCVCGAAIFNFTEYLRGQPATGEREAYEVSGGQLTEDRRILETQVLTARVSVESDPPVMVPEEFEKNVQTRIEEEEKSNPAFRRTPDVVAKVREDLWKSGVLSYRSIAPGTIGRYVFSRLGEARDRGLPLTFRYRVNSGSNAPDQIYKLTLSFSGDRPVVQDCGLGYFHTLQLFPSAVNSDGQVGLEIFNGDIYAGRPNPGTISFPPGGLEVSYVAAGYRMNFVRVVIVLWVKLAFLAMVAICAATFLSFPVACLVAFGTFFCAESASFLAEALDNYSAVDEHDNIIWYAVIIRAVALAVSGVFKAYSELRPTARLVDGTLLPWVAPAAVEAPSGATAGATRSLEHGLAYAWGWVRAAGVVQCAMLWSVVIAVFYGLSVLIMRRRELAVYSGH